MSKTTTNEPRSPLLYDDDLPGPMSLHRLAGLGAVRQLDDDSAYLTEDAGKSYRRLSDMPGEGMAWRLTLDPHDGNRLYVGTNGIGAWRAVIAENGSQNTAE